jgi:hypothetical protein
MTEIHFNKFKIIKDKKYRFWTKKNKELFFAYITVNEGVEAYKKEHKEYLFNKLNVYFSWQLFLKYLPLGLSPFIIFCFGMELYLSSQILMAIFFLSIIGNGIVSLFAQKFYKKYSFTCYLIDNIEDYSNERKLSNEVIEEYENKKPILNYFINFDFDRKRSKIN